MEGQTQSAGALLMRTQVKKRPATTSLAQNRIMLLAISLQSRPTAFIYSPFQQPQQRRCRTRAPICEAQRPQRMPPPQISSRTFSRRSVIATLAALLQLHHFPAHAAPLLPLEIYEDPSGFTLLRPTGWVRDRIVDGRRFAQAAGAGPGVAFSYTLDPTENLSVLSRAAPGAESGLSALGPPAGFGRNLVKSLSTPDGMRVANLNRAYARDGSGNVLPGGSLPVDGREYYVVEYSVASPKWLRKNICVAAVAADGSLVTLNIQGPSQRWSELKETYQIIAGSFTVF